MTSETTRILVVGSNGQLGRSFLKISESWKAHAFYFRNSSEMDITDLNSVIAQVDAINPDYLINCAAYTKVDVAEDEKEAASAVNEIAVGSLAAICKARQIVMLHYSTDYIYNPKTARDKLKEADVLRPENHYAVSKRRGEEAMLKIDPQGLIIRTSWVFSEYGNNFLKTMIRLGQNLEYLKVVNDQIGAPTYATDIAKCSMAIINQHLHKDVVLSGTSVYNYASEGQLSWYDFAMYIFACANISVNVAAIPTSEYPTKAMRPLWSVMDMTKIKAAFGIAPRYWKEAVLECVAVINDGNSSIVTTVD